MTDRFMGKHTRQFRVKNRPHFPTFCCPGIKERDRDVGCLFSKALAVPEVKSVNRMFTSYPIWTFPFFEATAITLNPERHIS